jgi:hypothetical protein
MQFLSHYKCRYIYTACTVLSEESKQLLRVQVYRHIRTYVCVVSVSERLRMPAILISKIATNATVSPAGIVPRKAAAAAGFPHRRAIRNSRSARICREAIAADHRRPTFLSKQTTATFGQSSATHKTGDDVQRRNRREAKCWTTTR